MLKDVSQHYIFFLKEAFEQSVLWMRSNKKWGEWKDTFLKQAAFRLTEFALNSTLPQKIDWEPGELVYEYVPYSKRNDSVHNGSLRTIDEITSAANPPRRYILVYRSSQFSENETIAVKLYWKHIINGKFPASHIWDGIVFNDSDFQRITQSTTNSVLETTSQSWVASSDPSSLPSFSDNITKIYNGTTLFVNPNEILNDANNSILSDTLWMIGGIFIVTAALSIALYMIQRIIHGIISYCSGGSLIESNDTTNDDGDLLKLVPWTGTETGPNFYNEQRELPTTNENQSNAYTCN